MENDDVKFSDLKRLLKSIPEYFLSSIKTPSTWILVIFNLFLLWKIISEQYSVAEAILLYVIQSLLSLVFLTILISSRKNFKINGELYSSSHNPQNQNILVTILVSILAIAFILALFGFVAYFLLSPVLNQIDRLSADFFITLSILLIAMIIGFIFSFNKERQIIQEIEIGNDAFIVINSLLPTFFGVIFLSMFRQEGASLIIAIKLLFEIITNSPMNLEKPFISHLFGAERLKRSNAEMIKNLKFKKI